MFEMIPCFNFKCNPIFNFIYIYSYWRIISHFSMFFERYSQNNLEYLVQNTNHHIAKTYISTLELIFWIYCLHVKYMQSLIGQNIYSSLVSLFCLKVWKILYEDQMFYCFILLDGYITWPISCIKFSDI